MDYFHLAVWVVYAILMRKYEVRQELEMIDSQKAAPGDLLSRFYDQVMRNVSGEEQAYDNLLTELDASDGDAGR